MLRVLKFVKLFRMLFGKGGLDVSRIEEMGLLCVKIAQMYAVRSDLLGTERCVALQGLYEQTRPIPWTEVERILREEAPPAFWEEVSAVDEDPMAAASLGQVHGATLRDGREVVVKVIKPRAREEFEKDLGAVKGLARCALTFYPKLKRLADPMGTIESIARLTRTEMDLRNEGRGTRRLEEMREDAEQLAHMRRLSFPKVCEELSGEQVLVSERLRVQSVSEGMKKGSFSYDQLLNLFRTQGYFLFLRGEFHGDLHPGNVFYEGDRLWFIDNANIEVADAKFTQGLLKFLGQLGEGAYGEAAKVMEEIALTRPRNEVRYRADFEQLYAGFESGKSSLTNQMMETVKLCVHAGMEFPEGAFPVIKSLMYLDGIALRCAPEANLLEDVLRYTGDLRPFE